MAELTLARIISDAERGRFPSEDPDGTVVPQPSARHAAVLAFTGHSVVAADVPADWVRRTLPPGDLSAPLCPPFLTALADREHARCGTTTTRGRGRRPTARAWYSAAGSPVGWRRRWR